MGRSSECHIGGRQRQAARGRIDRPIRLLRICRKWSAASGLDCGRSAIAAAGNHQYEGRQEPGTYKIPMIRRDGQARNFMHKVAR